MARERFMSRKFGIHSLTVIPDAKLKAPLAIIDLHLDATCGGVPARVPQGFARDPIDLVAYQRAQSARCAFDVELELGGPAMGRVARELFSKRPDRFGEFVRIRGRRPQPLHGLSSFGERFSCLTDGA